MKCSCGRKAVFFRKYEGRHLCKLCFLQSIEKRFRKTVGKYKLVRGGDKIVVALSGGKDSTTALYLMHGITKDRRDVELSAMIVDEGVLNFRKQCIKVARRFCRKLGVKLHEFSYRKFYGKTMNQVMKNKNKADACEYCAVARRLLLNKEARKLKATKICMVKPRVLS
mgnify:CR=1 FL=1